MKTIPIIKSTFLLVAFLLVGCTAIQQTEISESKQPESTFAIDQFPTKVDIVTPGMCQ